MISISGNALDAWIDAGIESQASMLAVNCCGYQKLLTRNLVRNRERGRVDYQLIYLIGGKGRFRIGGETRDVSAGQLVVYAPGQPQHYRYDAADGAEVYWLHFTGYGAESCLRQFGLLAGAVHAVGVMDEAVALYKKIIAELNMNKPFGGAVAAAGLLELLALCGRRLQNVESRRRAEPHADIHKIMAFMHERYNQHLSVADLARQCGLSLFRFIHKFKAATGTTPVQYITGIRINEAKKLLSETSLQVKEVAAIVGYENPLYFSRMFRGAVGIPPSRYQEQFR